MSFFAVKLEGPEVRSGRIRLDDFLRLGQEVVRAVERVALVLQGRVDSQRAGRRPMDLRTAVSLDVVAVTHGSPSTVIHFERTESQQTMPERDLGLEAFENFVLGLSAVTSDADTCPPGYDAGVLIAIRDAGRLFERGIDRIEFALDRPSAPIRTPYTREGYANIQRRIRGPQVNVRTIEGRLLMADFKERGSRLRVHPSSGEPVLCVFDESLRDEVYRNILHFVRVTGQAKEDPIANRIVSIAVSDIERMETREDQATDLLPTGAPLPSDFWQSLTFDELASAQGVEPLVDIRAIIGAWPGDVDDGFEEAVDKLRHAGRKS